jgi:hypothetical protein
MIVLVEATLITQRRVVVLFRINPRERQVFAVLSESTFCQRVEADEIDAVTDAEAQTEKLVNKVASL